MMRVFTPVKPQAAFHSRPGALVEALAGSGLMASPELHHTSARQIFQPRLKRNWLGGTADSQSVVLTPLAIAAELRRARWIDAYDDWSIAPDLSLPARGAAAVGYRALKNRSFSGLVTVNTPYMRDKLSGVPTLIVPNGVDRDLANWETGIGDQSRIVMVGHFFNGRTDWDLLARIASTRAVDEVVVFGAGKRLQAAISASGKRQPAIRLFPPSPLREIAKWITHRTALAVPHLVSSYTLSQDLMKVYQGVALGAAVVTPNALWPRSVPREHGLVFELGTETDDILAAAVEWPKPSRKGREAFALEHSWTRRASMIQEALQP